MSKQAVILAGGAGTRLKFRLKKLPKVLVKIGGKPLLEHQLNLLQSYGYTKIVLLVHYQADAIENFCKEIFRVGMDFTIIREDSPRGTAGAVFSAIDNLEDEFLVLYGDVMLDVDLAKFENFHSKDNNSVGTLLVHPNDHPHDSDLVEVNDNNEITKFIPKPHDPNVYYQNLVNAAVYIIRKTFFKEWHFKDNKCDFAKDVFPHILLKENILKAYMTPEYVKDCGTPERLDRVNNDFRNDIIAKSNLKFKQKAIFLDRDGTINEEVNILSDIDQFKLLPNVENSIKKINDSSYQSIVITNQSVIARGNCTLTELRSIHNKMETLLGQHHAYLTRLYYCPHHPDAGFPGELPTYKIHCNCRKPKPGMIDAACYELNIEKKESWLIGDSTVDIATAERSNIRSILVETGKAGMDGKYHVAQDFTFQDLPTAINFILDTFPNQKKSFETLASFICQGDIIFIGGLSKSGKSNFTSSLRIWLDNNNISAKILRLDGWLKSHNRRALNGNVFTRYEMDKIVGVVKKIRERSESVPINLPFYDKLARLASATNNQITIEPTDVVLVEGTIALKIATMCAIEPTYCWYLNIEEKVRRDRFTREYLLRGYTLENALSLYKSRQKDETPFIKATARQAGQIINSTMFDNEREIL